MALYPVATLYPGDTNAYPNYSSHPWSYDGTDSASYGGTIGYSYSTARDWTYG